MKRKGIEGFSLMEALLAIVVILIAGLGVYSLFEKGLYDAHLSDATTQAVEIANVYTDLASSNLTSATDDIPTLLQNSGRLSNKYFSLTLSGGSNATTMNNAFGQLTFANVTPYSFSVTVPLGCFTGDKTSVASVPGQFFTKVKDLYSCNDSGSKSYSDCVSGVTDCANGSRTSIKIYFSMIY